MVALKAAEAARFLGKPDGRYRIILLYGPDTGAVAERAAVLAAAFGVPDRADVVRLDADELAGDPARLSDEANAMSLFGGARVLRVRAGTKPFQKAVEPLLGAPPVDALVIIEAGDLAKSSPLRAMVERSSAAAALPCYLDEARDLGQLVDEEARLAGMRIASDARAMLIAGLGEDRLSSRAEIAKVFTYARGEPELTAEHIAAVASNVANTALDDMLDAAFAGDRSRAIEIFGRMIAAGERVDGVVSAVLRHVLLLMRGAASVEEGATPADAAGQLVKHFRRQRSVTTHLAQWSSRGLQTAAGACMEAQLAARRAPGMAPAIVERLLLTLGQWRSRRG